MSSKKGENMITFTVSMDVEDFIKLEQQGKEKDKKPENDAENKESPENDWHLTQSDVDAFMLHFRPDFRLTK